MHTTCVTQIHETLLIVNSLKKLQKITEECWSFKSNCVTCTRGTVQKLLKTVLYSYWKILIAQFIGVIV